MEDWLYMEGSQASSKTFKSKLKKLKTKGKK